MSDTRLKFELESWITKPVKEFLEEARVSVFDKGVVNLELVLKQAYDFKPTDGYTEHLERLNPALPEQVIVPQATETEKNEFDVRAAAQMDTDIQAAEELVHNAFKEIYAQQPDLEAEAFDLQG